MPPPPPRKPPPHWKIVFPRQGEADAGDPKYVQLMRALVDAIERGRIPEGVRLPSTRELASILQVGRNTVIQAVAGLVDQGYLIAKDRSGVKVSSARPKAAGIEGEAPAAGPDWDTRLTRGLRDVPPLSAQNARHSFVYGQFDAALFPIARWRECERAALGVREIARWGRDMGDEDDRELIEQLRSNVLPYQGIWATADEVLVTLGGQEGRYLVAQSLCRPGARVGLENPGMPDMNRMVGLTGATRVYLPLDESGLVLDAAFDSCHAVFSTASHQCPTAASMPVERRRRLLERARANDIVIVEDTFETESLAQGEEPSSLKSLDIDGRVIYIGSLSKHLAPGLRVGVVVAPRPVISKLRALRRLIHRHPPGNTQRALAMFIERGYYRSHVRRVARELDQRCAVFEEAMRQSLPDFRWQHRAGTASFWVHMPPQVDGARVQEEARREGLQLESGENFFHAGPVQRNTLRIGLSSTSEQSIREGITILQRVVQRLQPVARAKAKAKA